MRWMLAECQEAINTEKLKLPGAHDYMATVCLFNDWNERANGTASLPIAYSALAVSGLYVGLGVATCVYGFVQRSVSTQGDKAKVREMFLARGVPPVTGTAFMQPDGLDYE